MKEIKKYLCELCGTEYDSFEEAKECELYHKKIKGYEVPNKKYVPNEMYPRFITVKFEDGSKMTYQKVKNL